MSAYCGIGPSYWFSLASKCSTSIYSRYIDFLFPYSFFAGYDLPWEEKDVIYPNNMASPLEIMVEASNGASDYGNKFGEPVISGFARSYGSMDNAGIRREYIKPIMFSGGLGTMDANLADKVSFQSSYIHICSCSLKHREKCIIQKSTFFSLLFWNYSVS